MQNRGEPMAYTPYVSLEEYLKTARELIPQDDVDKMLRQASRHIDALTFNRIVAKGFDNLTEFQKDVVKEVVYRQAEFEYENEDMINTVLSSYSLNGVSMNFGSSWNLYIEMESQLEKIICFIRADRLCCRLVGV